MFKLKTGKHLQHNFMKFRLLLLLMLYAFFTNGQNSKDYIILKNQTDSITTDTLFGKIEDPGSGFSLKIKINTSDGIKKIKIKDASEFVVDDKFYGCFQYKKSYVHAIRLIKGDISLFFYYSGREGYYSGLIENVLQDIAADMTSYYYLKDNRTNRTIMVPHSKEKFKEQVADIFKDNDDLYEKIISGDFKPSQIAEIVTTYNDSKK